MAGPGPAAADPVSVPDLESTFRTIRPPVADAGKPVYAVLPVPGYGNYFVGSDTEGHACLLIAVPDHSPGPHPIRLRNLDAQFDMRCHLRRAGQPEREEVLTVVRCRTVETETTRYFLSVVRSLLPMLGDAPSGREVAGAVQRLAAMFQRILTPASRPVAGLFGELFLIAASTTPTRAVAAWRVTDDARFDFSDGHIRLDVKAAAGRVRSHIFSYEQCSPPPDTLAVVASLFAERTATGISLRELVDRIRNRIAAQPDLVFKLHDVVARTLGTSLNESMAVTFDAKLAASSLRFFDLRAIPAIRDPLPPGVSDVHFRSDLSAVSVLSVQSLSDRDPLFRDLLPLDPND